MSTELETLDITKYQNPVLKRNLEKGKRAIGEAHRALNYVRYIKVDETTRSQLWRADLDLRARLLEELKKPVVVRWFLRDVDEWTWRVKVVLNREFSEQIEAFFPDLDEQYEFLCDLWRYWEMEPSAHHGGAGRSYMRALGFCRKGYNLILEQNGGLDV